MTNLQFKKEGWFAPLLTTKTTNKPIMKTDSRQENPCGNRFRWLSFGHLECLAVHHQEVKAIAASAQIHFHDTGRHLTGFADQTT